MAAWSTECAARALVMGAFLSAALPGCGGGGGSEASDAASAADDAAPSGHDAGDPVSDLLPDIDFPPTTEADFEDNAVLGVRAVRERLLVGLTPEATPDQVRGLLDAAQEAELIGSLPEGRVVLLRFAGASAQALADARERLASLPGVSGAIELLRISPDYAPPPTAGPESRSWSYGADSWPLPADRAALNGTWALRAIGAPAAWNLLPWIVAQSPPVPPPVVGVIDSNFASHRDVRWTAANAFSAPNVAVPQHGLLVAGIIGSSWGNAQFADGVAPRVELAAADIRSISAGAVPNDADLYVSATRLLVAARRPRVINVSMGHTWDQDCFGRFRCDPRGGPRYPGPTAPDSNCPVEAIQRWVEDGGRIFRGFARNLQAGGAVLFVVSAGNSSGPLYDPNDPATLRCPPGTMLTGTETFCDLRGLGCFPNSGLGGRVPAALNSPMANASASPNEHDVIVVEAAAPAANSFGAMSLADFSNDGGDVVAPGVSVMGPNLDRSGGEILVPADGTSVASPLVAGAAAWLLSVDGTLTNDELFQALTSWTSGGRVGGSQTSSRLDLFGATLALDRLRPQRSLQHIYADLDDGTPDGFTREDPADPGRPYPGRRAPGSTSPVDMADFRALRDVYLMQSGLADLTCSPQTPACDLNGNGAFEGPAQESFPRAYLMSSQSSLVSRNGVGMFQRAFEGDPVQHWSADDLPALLNSADVWIHPEQFLLQAGAEELWVTLEGDVASGDPAVPNRVPLANTPVNRLMPLIMPLRAHPRLTVIAMRGGMPLGRPYAADFGDLRPGEDRHLVLNRCAWESDVGLLAPVTDSCPVPMDAPPPLPDGGYLWVRTRGPDLNELWVAEAGRADAMYGAYEPWQDRTFLRGIGALRGDDLLMVSGDLEFIGSQAGSFPVGRFHEGEGLPTGISLSLSDIPGAGGPPVSKRVDSVDMSINVQQYGIEQVDDFIVTFSGDGIYSDGAAGLAGVPVQVEGGFRGMRMPDVAAP